MIERLEQRIAQLQATIEQSAANHNSLIGRLNEMKDLLEVLQKEVEHEVDVAVSE